MVNKISNSELILILALWSMMLLNIAHNVDYIPTYIDIPFVILMLVSYIFNWNIESETAGDSNE